MEPIKNISYPLRLLPSPILYDNYFGRTQIIKLLCRLRVKLAQKSHHSHILREISNSPYSRNLLKHRQSSELYDLLPPRKQWYRPQENVRKKLGNAKKLYSWSIFKTIQTTHFRVQNSEIAAPEWYKNLNRFLDTISQRSQDPTIAAIETPKLIPLKKEKKRECKEFRPISLYNLQDKVLISLTTKYLTDLFDGCFHDSALAFRSTRNPKKLRSHHDSITSILEYLKQNGRKSIWVCECDINKFYDCVNQKEAKDALNRLAVQHNLLLDSRASEIYDQYLDSYAFNVNVLPHNSDPDYRKNILHGGQFSWPEAQLANEHYGLWIESERIGIPQGGALSCLIANLVLHDADSRVMAGGFDAKLFYRRFCDDMILMHTSKRKCELGLRKYEAAVTQKRLIVHPPKSIERYGKSFWESKSKKPYRWASKQVSAASVPWISFVGYQVRYDGTIRVRKKSIEKEILKQTNEVIDVEKALGLFSKYKSPESIFYPRKAKQQLFSSVQKKLISMSVGKVALHTLAIFIPAFCWSDGFKSLLKNKVSESQLKALDRHRDVVLNRFKRKSSKIDRKSSSNKGRKNVYRYYGSPFGYGGIFNFVSRPRQKSK